MSVCGGFVVERGNLWFGPRCALAVAVRDNRSICAQFKPSRRQLLVSSLHAVGFLRYVDPVGIEWIENPKQLRLADGRVLQPSCALGRAEARRMSRTRQVIASVFPDLYDVTADDDRVREMLRDSGEQSELFAWTAHLYSGDGATAVVFDYAH